MEFIVNFSHLFFNKLLWNAVFPSTILLLIFTFYHLKAFKLNKQLIFILIAFTIVFMIHAVFGVLLGAGGDGGWDCESRRFYIIAVLTIPFCVLGFPKLIEISEKIYYKFSKKEDINKNKVNRRVLLFWILIFTISCIGKGLSPQSYKEYVNEPGQIIKKNTSKNLNTLFINDDYYDMRSKYYSGADKFLTINEILNKNTPKAFYTKLDNYIKHGYKPFIFTDNSNDKFKKIFTDKNVKFKLNLLKEWKNGEYSLYEYNG
jgi:hypothetical protein